MFQEKDFLQFAAGEIRQGKAGNAGISPDGGFANISSIVKVNATLQDFEGDIGRGVAFSLTKRCV